MIKDIDKCMAIEIQSVDGIVSKWMGYYLFYESLLNSVIYFHDHCLKPIVLILLDIAKMYVAGVGKGGTSLSFWEMYMDSTCLVFVRKWLKMLLNRQ